MTDRKRTKEELLKTLRREIFAAQMKVILDKELGRTTSPTVRKLAELKRPPFTETQPQKLEVASAKFRTSKRYVSRKNGVLAAAARRRAISGAVSAKQD